MVSTHTETVLNLANEQQIIKPGDLEAAGVPRIVLTRLVRSGQLKRVSRGRYMLPDHSFGAHENLALVASKVRQGVFCLLTALQFHELTTQSPFQIWLAIPNKAQPPKLEYPPLRIFRFSGDALTEGVEIHRVEECEIQVYSVAKTVVDCFKFRNKIGLDVALEALKEAWREKRATMDELWKYAQICRMTNVMRPYLETLE